MAGIKHAIVEGQIYRKTGRGGGAWQVVAVKIDALGAQHARMISMSEPGTYRTVAIAVLHDARNFQRVEAAAR
jgi:hypothetical protein